jgi:hypothetical protein
MLGGEGLLRRTQAKPSRCLRTETLPMPSAIMLGGARPVASDPALPNGGARVASTCGDIHLAASRPHALGQALPWLRPTVGIKSGTRRRRYPTSAPVLTHTMVTRVQRSAAGSLPAWRSSPRNVRR